MSRSPDESAIKGRKPLKAENGTTIESSPGITDARRFAGYNPGIQQ
jgi:hypothetical protein